MKCRLWLKRLERSRRKVEKLESQQSTKKRNVLNAVKPDIFESTAGAKMAKIIITNN